MPDNEANSTASATLQTDAENWQQLQELYHLLEATPADERAALLEQTGSDPQLCTRVLSLLAAATVPEVRPEWQGSRISPGSRVGAYTVLQHLGTGGLGSVYLTERLVGGAVQHCAVKVLSVSPLSEPAFHAKFTREQQILASLHHPNITHFLDAGISATGSPYLVMEFVEGKDLTRFCDDQYLSIRRRLSIFLDICDAVTYAHSNLIAHLDLKPSNVLVTDESTVKLLDFGTSQMLDPENTTTTTVLATPAYASPEQLRGDPASTASDLYSLGAMLYELLSGQRPFENSSAAMAISRAAKEQEPSRLTTAITEAGAAARGVTSARLSQDLEGDLASIVAHCLRSRPQDRYPSVQALADDLRRHLDGRPVQARQQTLVYRFTKFARRHRLGIAAALTVSLLLLGATGYAYVRQQQAIREARRAERMQTFLYRLLYVANSNYTGKTSFSVPDFLGLGAKLAPRYITEPSDLRRAQLGLAESMFENDDTNGADDLLQKVIRSAQESGDFNTQAEAEATEGYIAFEKGRTAQAESLTGHALELSHRRGSSAEVRVWAAVYFAVVRDESGERTASNLKLIEDAVQTAQKSELPERERADALYNLGLAYGWRHQYAASKEAYGRALVIYERDPEAQCDRADVRRGLAQADEALGNVQASLPEYQHAFLDSVQCSGPNSLRALNSQSFVMDGLLQSGRAREAQELMQAAMPAWKQLGIAGPKLDRPHRLLAEAYVDLAKFREAEAEIEKALGSETSSERDQSPEMALLQLVWARALAGQHKTAEALPHAREAERLLSADRESPQAKRRAA